LYRTGGHILILGGGGPLHIVMPGFLDHSLATCG